MDIYLRQDDCSKVIDEFIKKDIKVDLIVTDPPYDIRNTKAGGKSKLAKSIQNANNDIEKAKLTKGFNYVEILNKLIKLQNKINMYIWCNKAQLPFYLDYFVIKNKCSFDLIKWVKTNPIPTFYNKYMSDTEYCLYVRKGGYCMPNNFQDGSTLYQAPINSKDKRKYKHPTIKPLDIIEKLIRNSSKKGQIILDPFMGSGTTIVAAAKLGRDAIGIEINEDYFKIAQKRIKNIKKQLNLF